MHRAERRIELQTADRACLLLERRALRRGPIAAAALDLEHHVQLAGAGQVRDNEVRVHDLDVVIELDIARSNRPRALLRNPQFGGVARVHAHGHLLQVEQDVDHVLLHALDAGVLVEYALDLRLRDRRARHGRQQNAAQRVAQRMAETTLERFDGDLRLKVIDRRHLDDARLQKLIYRFLHGNNPS